MEYKQLEPITKDQVEESLSTSDDNFILAETLFRMVYSIDDIDFVEKNIINISKIDSLHKQVITSISDFVSINRCLTETLKKLLKNFKNDSSLTTYVKEIEDDIKNFLKIK